MGKRKKRVNWNETQNRITEFKGLKSQSDIKDGVKKMDTDKPKQGAWAEMDTTKRERKPQIKWAEAGGFHTVTFQEDEPFEFVKPDETSFYIFNVDEEGEDKVILTSAWSLLRGLKEHMPLKGKRLCITKKVEGGKQRYEVVDIDEVKEEKV